MDASPPSTPLTRALDEISIELTLRCNLSCAMCAVWEGRRDGLAGDRVAVVSYARERSERPSLEDACRVLETRPDRVVVLDCSIDFGASGSPVFRLGPEGAQIVSVISALARSEGAAGRTASRESWRWQCSVWPRRSVRELRSVRDCGCGEWAPRPQALPTGRA
jgi:hypothetical protein